MNKYFTAISFSLLTIFSAQQAFADCNDMGNDEWNELSLQMATAYDQNNLDEALTAAKRLSLICNRSPIVNYTMSEIYRKTDNEQESYNHVKRATEYMLEYPVPQALTEKIWMRRAEFDLPYKKQLADLKNQLETGTGEYGSRYKQTENDLTLVSRELLNLESQNQELLKSQLKTLNTTKWIGAGTALGGLVMAAAGAGLLGTYYSKASDQYGVKWNEFDKKDAMVHGGIVLVAGGIGLGLAGSAVAIYSFIKSTQIESANSNLLENDNSAEIPVDEETPMDEESQANSVNFNFGVAPNAVFFDLTF